MIESYAFFEKSNFTDDGIVFELVFRWKKEATQTFLPRYKDGEAPA